MIIIESEAKTQNELSLILNQSQSKLVVVCLSTSQNNQVGLGIFSNFHKISDFISSSKNSLYEKSKYFGVFFEQVKNQ